MVPRGSAELRNSGSALLCVAGSALACTQGSRLCALHYFLICKEMKHSIRQGLQERRICSETLVLWHCSQRPGLISDQCGLCASQGRPLPGAAHQAAAPFAGCCCCFWRNTHSVSSFDPRFLSNEINKIISLDINCSGSLFFSCISLVRRIQAIRALVPSD